MKNKKKHTVLLLLPDYIATDYGQETHMVHVEAETVGDAIMKAKWDAHEIYHSEEPTDWFTLAVFEGQPCSASVMRLYGLTPSGPVATFLVFYVRAATPLARLPEARSQNKLAAENAQTPGLASGVFSIRSFSSSASGDWLALDSSAFSFSSPFFCALARLAAGYLEDLQDT